MKDNLEQAKIILAKCYLSGVEDFLMTEIERFFGIDHGPLYDRPYQVMEDYLEARGEEIW